MLPAVICRPEQFRKPGWEQTTHMLASNVSWGKNLQRSSRLLIGMSLLRHSKCINWKTAGAWGRHREGEGERTPSGHVLHMRKREEHFESDKKFLAQIPAKLPTKASARRQRMEMKHLWIMLR